MDNKNYILKLQFGDKKAEINIPTYDNKINVTTILEVACHLFEEMGAKIFYESFKPFERQFSNSNDTAGV